LLIDPFIAEGPAYSKKSTGVRFIDEETGFGVVDLLGVFKGSLEGAGWVEVDSKPSEATGEHIVLQIRSAAVPDPQPPLVKLPDPCSSSVNPQEVLISIGGAAYLSYNPYIYEEPPNECGDRIYYAMGETTLETYENLLAKIGEAGLYNATFEGEYTDPSLPFMQTRYRMKLTSITPAYENDEVPISINGSGNSLGGYYLMRSPPNSEGRTLTVKLQTAYLNFGAIDYTGTLGIKRPILTVAGGNPDEGAIVFPVYNSGEYFVHAATNQFVIWTKRTGRTGSMLLLSMPLVDHAPNKNPIIAVTSESLSWYGLSNDFQRLIRNMHWHESYGSGFDNILTDVGWRSQSPSTVGERSPTLLFRGLRAGVALQTIRNAPLAQAAYLLMSGEPKGQGPDRIAGRLWDMLITSDVVEADLDGRMMYDNQSWRRLSVPINTGDLAGTLWILEQPRNDEED
jgi:hypothetical protein